MQDYVRQNYKHLLLTHDDDQAIGNGAEVTFSIEHWNVISIDKMIPAPSTGPLFGCSDDEYNLFDESGCLLDYCRQAGIMTLHGEVVYSDMTTAIVRTTITDNEYENILCECYGCCESDRYDVCEDDCCELCEQVVPEGSLSDLFQELFGSILNKTLEVRLPGMGESTRDRKIKEDLEMFKHLKDQGFEKVENYIQSNGIAKHSKGIALFNYDKDAYTVYDAKSKTFCNVKRDDLAKDNTLYFVPADKVNEGDIVFQHDTLYYIVEYTNDGIEVINYATHKKETLIPDTCGDSNKKSFVKVVDLLDNEKNGVLLDNQTILAELLNASGNDMNSQVMTALMAKGKDLSEIITNPIILSNLSKNQNFVNAMMVSSLAKIANPTKKGE